jgi:hypothetical protein
MRFTFTASGLRLEVRGVVGRVRFQKTLPPAGSAGFPAAPLTVFKTETRFDPRGARTWEVAKRRISESLGAKGKRLNGSGAWWNLVDVPGQGGN